MKSYGIKISLPAKDITSTDPNDYVLHSGYYAVKTAIEPPNKTYATLTINASSSNTLTVAHNLGFPPLVLVFTEFNVGSGRWYCGHALPDPTDTGQITMNGIDFVSLTNAGTYVDSTNLYLKYTNLTGSQKTIKIYYYIFGDDAAT